MAFKHPPRHREQIELVSLIDMIFILLVFFLVTSFVIRMPMQERSLYVPTPENQTGRAQILIQLIDEEHVFWLDDQASSVVEEMESNYGYLSPSRLRDQIVRTLQKRYTISFDVLEARLQTLRDRAEADPGARFFVLIRCPDALPFYRVVNILTFLSEARYRNLKYGCVGGTLDDIQNCRRVTVVAERDRDGSIRKNIRFDF